MHYIIKKEIGKKKRMLQPLLPNLFFVYATRETVNSIIKKKGEETSVLKFYLDKTKPLEDNGKHPPSHNSIYINDELYQSYKYRQ